MRLNRKKGFLCASVSLWLMITAAMVGVAADKPVDNEFKALLEKYAAAYSAMDAKALEPLVSKELLEQHKEQFHQYRKNHQKPELSIVYSKQNNDVTLEATATLKVNGKDVYANQPTIYTLKDKRITAFQRQDVAAKTSAVPSKRGTESFWDAVKVSDAIGIITVEAQAVKPDEKAPEAAKEAITVSRPVVTSSVKTLLSGEPVTGEEVKLPKWVTFQLKPGRHLLPLTKSGKNFEAFGMGYEVPVIQADSEKLFAEIFIQYKQLPPEKENEFLKNLLLDEKLKTLHYAALRKIAMSEEFKQKLNVQAMEFWHKVYLAQDDIMLKKALLSQLSSKNFDLASPLFLTALEDKQLSGMVGGLFLRQDKAGFTAKMLQYLEDPAKREIALKNSFLLASNPEYVAKAMKCFDPNDKKMFMAFIPILTAKDNKAGKEIIAKFLKESDPKKDFNARMMLFSLFWRNNDPAYIAETKAFLAEMEKSEMLRKSSAYPTALGYLYKNNDLDGMKMLLKYLESVKPGSREEMMLRSLMFSLKIKPENMLLQTDNVSSSKTNLNRELFPIAMTPVLDTVAVNKSNKANSHVQVAPNGQINILRRDLEAKIKAFEYIQQNFKNNIKNN